LLRMGQVRGKPRSWRAGTDGGGQTAGYEHAVGGDEKATRGDVWRRVSGALAERFRRGRQAEGEESNTTHDHDSSALTAASTAHAAQPPGLALIGVAFGVTGSSDVAPCRGRGCPCSLGGVGMWPVEPATLLRSASGGIFILFSGWR
jgi:hypothetical protein